MPDISGLKSEPEERKRKKERKKERALTSFLNSPHTF